MIGKYIFMFLKDVLYAHQGYIYQNAKKSAFVYVYIYSVFTYILYICVCVYIYTHSHKKIIIILTFHNLKRIAPLRIIGNITIETYIWMQCINCQEKPSPKVYLIFLMQNVI